MCRKVLYAQGWISESDAWCDSESNPSSRILILTVGMTDQGFLSECCQVWNYLMQEWNKEVLKQPWVRLSPYNWWSAQQCWRFSLNQKSVSWNRLFLQVVLWRKTFCPYQLANSDACYSDNSCAEETRLSMTMPLHDSQKERRCLCLTNDGWLRVSVASLGLSFPFCWCSTLTKGKEERFFKHQCHRKETQGRTKPDLQESAQGVTGKPVQATLMVCQSKNVCRKPRLQPLQQMRVQARLDCSLIAK